MFMDNNSGHIIHQKAILHVEPSNRHRVKLDYHSTLIHIIGINKSSDYHGYIFIGIPTKSINYTLPCAIFFTYDHHLGNRLISSGCSGI